MSKTYFVRKSFHFVADVAKWEWRQLRDTYRRHQKSLATVSGQARKKRKPYRFAKEMEFLKTHTQGRDTSSNLDYEETSQVEQESYCSDRSENELSEEEEETMVKQVASTSRPATPQSATPKTIGKRRRASKDVDPLSEKIITYLDKKQAEEPAQGDPYENDEDMLFFRSQMPTFKLLTARERASMRLEFQQKLNNLAFPPPTPSQGAMANQEPPVYVQQASGSFMGQLQSNTMNYYQNL